MTTRHSRARPFRVAVAFAVLASVAGTAVANHQSSSPIGAECFLVADQGDYPGDRDLLTRIDTGKPNPPGPNESAIGFTGTLGIEALAMDPSDGTLYAADEAILGTLDEHTGAFDPVTGDPFGPGTGAQGTQSLKNADGISFDPTDGSLYASIRRGTNREDLLIRVDPSTGHHINDAFGAGHDYAVVPAPNSLDDIDDLAFDADGRLWAIINDGGLNSTLVQIDKRTGRLDAAYTAKRIAGHANATDMESLAWADESGTPTLFGLNGKAVSGSTAYISRLWEIDPATGLVSGPRSNIGESAGVAGARDYEGMVCGGASGGCDLFSAVPQLGGTGGANRTFTVSLGACVGAVAGARPDITVSPPDDEVSNTCETQGTNAAGECTVTIASPAAAGTTVVTASVSGVFNGRTYALQDEARMVWIGSSMCLDVAAPSEKLPLVTSFIVPDTDPMSAGLQGLTDVVVTADVSVGAVVSSAERIAGVTPSISGTRIRYRFASLAPGTYAGRIQARLEPDLPDGTDLTNRVTIEAGGHAGSATASHGLAVTNDASARAFGLTAGLLGDSYVVGDALAPDTDAGDRGDLASVPNPLPGATGPLARSMTVSESATSDANHVETTALAHVLETDLEIPGVIRVQADVVVTRATSTASVNGANATGAGSTIANLRIDGVPYGDISEPTTLAIKHVGGDPFVEVRLLERALADSVPAGSNSAAIEVNGIHVVVHDLASTPVNESSDVVVAHADAAAAFGPATDCRAAPIVAGDAAVLRVLNAQPASADVLVGDVWLPSSGAAVEDHRTGIDLPIGRAEAAESSVSATLGFSPARADVSARARAVRGNLVSGAITFAAVEASSNCSLVGCAGDTTIDKLVVGGTAVCTALGLASTCEPGPNTVLLLPGPGPVLVLLNEQASEPDGLTVNAVHVFALGRGNVLGLPAGAEMIVSGARASARA